jgi:hypothetical protein
MTHRIVIPAAGQQTRWKRETGKHFVDVFGEQLIVRTIRQLRERGIDDIIAVTPAPWAIDAECARPVHRADEAETDKILSSIDQWSPFGRTTILFGDVYFTDKAMDTILGTPRQVVWFGRRGASKHTGKKHGEIFGVSFDGVRNEIFCEFCETVRRQRSVAQQTRGPVHRKSQFAKWAGGRRVKDRQRGTARACYEAMAPVPWVKYVEIDDMTEDFDTVEDYETWLGRQGQ